MPWTPLPSTVSRSGAHFAQKAPIWDDVNASLLQWLCSSFSFMTFSLSLYCLDHCKENQPQKKKRPRSKSKLGKEGSFFFTVITILHMCTFFQTVLAE